MDESQKKVCYKCNAAPRASSSSYCRTCSNEVSRNWQKRNPEKVRARTQAYRKANPEMVAKWDATYNSKNRERRIAYMREHYRLNKAARDRQNKQWAIDNPEAAKRCHIMKRAAKCGHNEHFTLEEFIDFLKIDRCEDCGTNENLTVGHRFPIMYPSSNNLAPNLIRQCGGPSGKNGCNRRQGIKLHHSVYTDQLAKLYPFWFGCKGDDEAERLIEEC